MSNARPHTHEIQVTQYYSDGGSWRVKYGDSKVRLWLSWNHWPKLFWQRRVRRAARRVIRKHDRGSMRYGARMERRDRNQAFARQLSLDLNKVGTGSWGSDRP